MKDPIKGRRYCYTVVDADHQDPKKHGGFMPSMIIEGETGHYPMQGGDHQWAVPWSWGKTVKAASAACERFNADRLGVSKEVAAEIKDSTF